ncbi:cold-shock protein [Paenibacillus hexagrammi]|uniref:Cold-shock protein n=1 Tax=Paenibacillus hexagrammi TaxID=2908839 RepID=A0ABY3SIA1_9BACL|nr:cold-shock protein [Paenibacillus sp. YPD9-1]UJF33454.1 cold-shock protein [Paenibacillus sp. YPD9-1]
MYSRKKPMEEVPVENTPIWSCTEDSCKGWIRDNFAFESIPTCPLCSSAMVRSEKLLPVLTNTSTYQKPVKKGASI